MVGKEIHREDLLLFINKLGILIVSVKENR